MSEFETALATMTERAKTIEPMNKSIKFILDDQIMVVDGTGDVVSVSTEDTDSADAVVKASVENFNKLLQKELNPMLAFRKGLVRIEGDMMAATALQQMF